MNIFSFPSLTSVHNLSLINNSTLSQSALCSAYQSRWTAWYVATIFLYILVGSFNLLCFITICKNPALRTGSGILIGHFVLIETVLCLVLSPIQTTFVFIHLSSTLTCRISQFIFAVVNHAVFFNILVLAINRFVAVVFPLRYRLLSQPKWIKFFVSFVWLVSVILNIPMEFNGGAGHYGVDRVWGG